MRRYGERTRVTTQVNTWLPQVPGNPGAFGPVIWFDASDASTITSSSGSVSQWDDKSGNGYHVAQSTAANQPTTGSRTQNGLNVIDFDGSNDQLRRLTQDITQIRTARAVTQFVVIKSDRTSSSNEGIFGLETTADDYASGYVHYRRTTNIDVSLGRGTTGFGSANYQVWGYSNSSTSPQVLSWTASAAANEITAQANNVSQTLTSVEGTMATSAFLGTTTDSHRINMGSRGAFNNPFDGWIAEIIVYAKVLTSTERTLVHDFLKTKWGI